MIKLESLIGILGQGRINADFIIRVIRVKIYNLKIHIYSQKLIWAFTYNNHGRKKEELK
jgi:hypothetical protein